MNRLTRVTRFAARFNPHESRKLNRVYSADSDSDRTRKVLPMELSSDVLALTCSSSAEGGVCHVFVVGTFHCFQESCKKVEQIVRYLKPEVVFLELCRSRKGAVKLKNWMPQTSEERREMLKKTADFNAKLRLLSKWSFAKAQEELDLVPGGEFRVAYEEAKKYGGQVVFGDRPLDITRKRIWRTMPFWQKVKLITSALYSTTNLYKMVSERDFATLKSATLNMLKKFPTLEETLVNERDRYMSFKLRQTASTKSLVVAVVGLGHLPGIEKNWNQPISAEEIEDILKLPPKKKLLVSIQESLKGFFARGLSYLKI